MVALSQKPSSEVKSQREQRLGPVEGLDLDGVVHRRAHENE